MDACGRKSGKRKGRREGEKGKSMVLCKAFEMDGWIA
jgi:hypothetical protein